MVFKRKFKDDVETKGELKKYGKENSKKEEAFDKTEKFAKGGKVDPRVAAMMAARMQAMQQRPPMPPQGMPPPGMKKGGSVEKTQEKEHASTLSRIAKQEAAEAAKMKKGGKVKYAVGGEVRGTGAAIKGTRFGGMTGLKKGGRC